ncbi:tyrosine-type recombinase/integrase [Psittacicella gerlachiana]|uniref:Tyrosine recombinase XerC n=1 Tax=Psittacicella gerlachiana TaxID=2028574 RepID=A0A3A1YDU8_9GAMM|nr:tyrosine-type recombinase/integrase [Psittacicella gerlachiana]RIY35596.1 hypothetical protein CKF59_03365 [Psittacicella gerlachiana]
MSKITNITTLFPDFVKKDLESFLQYIKLEKSYSNNTLLAYRNNLLQALNAIYQVLTKEEQKQAPDELMDLSAILGKRKAKKSTIPELTAETDQPKAQSSESLPLTSFTWESCQVEIIKQAISAELHPQKSASSRNQFLSALRSFFQWLLINDKVKANYPKLVKNLKVEKNLPVVIEKSTMEQILETVIIRNFLELRDQVIFEMMFNTGVRLSEVCNLNLQDLDFSKNQIQILGKGNVYRHIPLSIGLKQLIALYLVLREREILDKLDESQLAELNIDPTLNLNLNINDAGQVYHYATNILANANRYTNTQSANSVGKGRKRASAASQMLSAHLHEAPIKDLGLSKQEQQAIELSNAEAGIMSLADLKALQKKKANPLKTNTDINNSISAEVSQNSMQNHTNLLNSAGYELQLEEQSKEHLKHRFHPLHALFLSTHLKRITARAIQYRLDQRVLKSGVKRKLSPHKLRHSFATQFLKNSSNLRAVQEILGHKNLVTTQIYTHLDLEHLIQVYNQAHPQQIKHQEELLARKEQEQKIKAWHKQQGRKTKANQQEKLIAQIKAKKDQ